jgi:hypothetical protein
MSDLRRICPIFSMLDIDPQTGTSVVDPGVALSDLTSATAAARDQNAERRAGPHVCGAGPSDRCPGTLRPEDTWTLGLLGQQRENRVVVTGTLQRV